MNLVSRLAGSFIQLNKKASDYVEKMLPRLFIRSLLYQHELISADLMNSISNCRIVDMGGGHLSPFAHHRKSASDTYIIGADILLEQVQGNSAIDAGLVCDACAGLPFKSNSIDIVVTRSGIEHLPTVEAFLVECQRVLKPGGYLVSVHPCRRAPFALSNRFQP